MSTLHVYLDESGNWEFSAKGTRYFSIGVLWTLDPAPLAASLQALRFELLREGLDIESFHASPDKQSTRNRVFEAMLRVPNWEFTAFLMEKRRVNPSIRDPQRFYPAIALPAVRLALRYGASSASRVLVFADTINLATNAKREGVLKAIKRACADQLKDGQPHHAYSHRRESNTLLQAVDYCLWAVARKWEKGDARAYAGVRPRLTVPELCITDRGDGLSYY